MNLPRGDVLHGLYGESAATYYQNQGAQTIIGDTRLGANQEVDVGIWWEQPSPKDLPQRIAFEIVLSDVNYVLRKNDVEGDDGRRVSRYPFIEARLHATYYDAVFIGCIGDNAEIDIKRRIGNLPNQLRSNVLCVRLESLIRDVRT